MPNIISGTGNIAKAFVFMGVNNYPSAFEAMRIELLGNHFTSDEVESHQLAFLRKFVNGTLSDADEKKLAHEEVVDKMVPWADAGNDAPAGYLCISLASHVTSLTYVLTPWRTTGTKVKDAVAEFKGSITLLMMS